MSDLLDDIDMMLSSLYREGSGETLDSIRDRFVELEAALAAAEADKVELLTLVDWITEQPEKARRLIAEYRRDLASSVARKAEGASDE